MYERTDWRDIYASRAIRATCARQQTAYSSTSKDGASLGLILKERERLCEWWFVELSSSFMMNCRKFALKCIMLFVSLIDSKK